MEKFRGFRGETARRLEPAAARGGPGYLHLLGSWPLIVLAAVLVVPSISP